MRTLLFALLAMVACGSPPPAHSESPTLFMQPQCDFVNYRHNESTNVQGPGKCTTDCDCDGVRSCTEGSCTGVARPDPSDTSACGDPAYKWNEAWNGGGPGTCANDCQCNGTRHCVAGHCQAAPTQGGDAAHNR